MLLFNKLMLCFLAISTTSVLSQSEIADVFDRHQMNLRVPISTIIHTVDVKELEKLFQEYLDTTEDFKKPHNIDVVQNVEAVPSGRKKREVEDEDERRNNVAAAGDDFVIGHDLEESIRKAKEQVAKTMAKAGNPDDIKAFYLRGNLTITPL